MKVGLMQPYLFPYLGYFQLIYATDLFLIYDNVQYRKGGRINRNQILNKANNKPLLFTIPVVKDSYEKDINQRCFDERMAHHYKKFRMQLVSNYGKAPYFDEVMELVDEIFAYDDLNVAHFCTNALQKVCTYLNIDTTIALNSKKVRMKEELEREERVIGIVKQVNGTHYINPIGGIELYDKAKFKSHELQLSFLKMNEDIEYPQFNPPFVPGLSILDVMMFNSKNSIARLLTAYKLVNEGGK